MHKPAAENIKTSLPLPDKLFYKIGEVGKITGVEPYVLRYWETEFHFLRPRKNKAGQRVYVKKDLELIMHVKKMLYQERYTIEGVRKRFGEGMLKEAEQETASDKRMKRSKNPAEAIEFVKTRLKEILEQLK
jgi:DNA-binding transcriptional MerR regulator